MKQKLVRYIILCLDYALNIVLSMKTCVQCGFYSKTFPYFKKNMTQNQSSILA